MKVTYNLNTAFILLLIFAVVIWWWLCQDEPEPPDRETDNIDYLPYLVNKGQAS